MHPCAPSPAACASLTLELFPEEQPGINSTSPTCCVISALGNDIWRKPQLRKTIQHLVNLRISLFSRQKDSSHGSSSPAFHPGPCWEDHTAVQPVLRGNSWQSHSCPSCITPLISVHHSWGRKCPPAVSFPPSHSLYKWCSCTTLISPPFYRHDESITLTT